MKKIILPFIFLITFIPHYSQNIKDYELEINYEIFYNTDIPKTKRGKLLINNSLNKSVFLYGKKKHKTKIDESVDEIVIHFKNSERYNYFDFSSKNLYSKVKIYDKEYVVKEDIPQLKWILHSNKKKIDELVVSKATLSFRGRNYIAWYCLKYPLKYGPWKFYGLPGLIIEVYDDKKRYHWLVKSISKTTNPIINNFRMDNDLKIIDLKEYVDLRYNSNFKLINESKLPRGTRIEYTKLKRNGIETIFAWE